MSLISRISAVVAAIGADIKAMRGIEVVNTSTNRVLSLDDRGKTIRSSGGNITIPASLASAFPMGSTFMVVNYGGSSITIDGDTSNSFIKAGAGSAGIITLAAYGVAVFHKIDGATGAAAWLVSGAGVL